MEEIKIRKIKKEEIDNALKLVWNVFLEYEAPDYTEEGIKEFKKTIDDKNWINQREFYGAFDENNKLLGVIATKDLTHIALFFVDGNYHKQGIGKKLYLEIKKRTKGKILTVNSSPYAHEVYKHLGFVDIDNEQCINGLKFYPMKLEQKLNSKEFLGKKVHAIIDRPMGSKHPKWNYIYPVNYGYIPNTISGDGEELDCYVLGIFEPLNEFDGKCIAIIHRTNDNDDKLIIVPEEKTYTSEQIEALVEFQEKFFKHEIYTF